MKIDLNGTVVQVRSLPKDSGEIQTDCPKCSGRSKLQINLRKQVYHCYKCKWSGKFQLETPAKYWKPIVGKHVDEAGFKIPGFKPLCFDANMLMFFQLRNLTLVEPTKRGWGMSTDFKLRNRLIIPIVEGGKTVCYVARSTDPNTKLKEMSPPASVSNKSHYWYGLDDVLLWAEYVVIVEGIFDCEAVRRLGYICIAAMGGHLSSIQIGKLLQKKPRCIVIMFDGDAPGRCGMADAMEALKRRNYLNVKLAWLPNDTDPDELTPSHLQAVLQNVTEENYDD